MTSLAHNKRARFDYELLQKYEAGLVLLGHEVKSVKTGHVSLKGAFVTIRGGEFYLTNAMIPLYKHAGNITDYDPTRSRKLLLNKAEMKSLIGKKQTEGLTLVPLRVYTKGRHVKLSFALAKGKKKHDKRQAIAERESRRKVSRALRTKTR